VENIIPGSTAGEVLPFMSPTACPSPALSVALSDTGIAVRHLSPSTAGLRDRFRDLVGFKRGIIHELGHGLVAIHLGHRLVSVTVEPAGDLGAACMYAFDRRVVGTDTFRAERAVVASAGRVAVVMALDGYTLSDTEFACSIDSHHEEYGHDDRMLRSLAECPNLAYHRWVRHVSEQAWSILAAPYIWSALMRLARELKRERTLTGDRVRKVLAEEMAVAG